MSTKVSVYDSSTEKITTEEYEVDFIDEINVGLLHQVSIASRTNLRNRTASTKTRSQVSGTGAKPWMQKGTGRARAGSLRSVQFKGGGVVHGPGGSVYKDRTPKRMKRKALQMATSQRFKEDALCILDAVGWDSPSTNQANIVLEQIGMNKTVLFVSLINEISLIKSFRNIKNLTVKTPEKISAIDVIMNDYILITKEAFSYLIKGRI